jgi:drug/metabolite transporter (DMT)-like permease
MQKKTDHDLARSVQPGLRPMDLVAVAALVACCMSWGLNQVAMKVTNDGITPMFQASLRCAIAAGLIWIWALLRGIPLFARDRTLWPGIFTGMLFAVNFMFIGVGLSYTEASRGVLFLYTAPFFVAIGAHYLLPGDQLSWLKVAGLLAAFAGLMVSVSDRLTLGGTAETLRGDLYCMFAGLFWALTTLVVRATLLRSISAEKNLFYQLVVAAPMLLAASWLAGEAGIVNLSPLIVWSFLYTTVVVVFVSYAVWFWLLNTYPASQVSVFTFLAPIFAVIAGHVLLNEPVTWRLAAALTLVALGIYLVNRPQVSRQAKG